MHKPAFCLTEASGVVYEKSRWLTKDDPEWAGLDGECDVLPFPDQQSLEYDEDAPMFDECPHFLARQAGE